MPALSRRGFFGAIGAVAAAAAVPKVEAPPAPDWRTLPSEPVVVAPAPIRVERANGKAFILGVATEAVRKGDLVQIQTYGVSDVNTR